MTDKKPKDYWRECGQVFFHFGVGHGLTKELKNIPLGSEEDIKKYFETGELNDKLKSKQKELLTEILNYRKEQGIGNIGRTSMERRGNHGTSRRKPRATRPFASRKRLPLRPSRAKDKSLSGR